MPKTTHATVKSKGFAVYRILIGAAFIALGLYRHFADGAAPDAGVFTLVIGLLFLAYGLYAFFVGNKVTIETQTPIPPTPTERLGEILQLKTQGHISEQEYETKRQEILKGL